MTDDDAHARRVAEQLRMAEEWDEDDGCEEGCDR